MSETAACSGDHSMTLDQSTDEEGPPSGSEQSMERGPLEFNVEAKQPVGQDKDQNVWDAYRNFVKDLQALGDHTNLSWKKKAFFDVILRTNAHMIRLRLSRSFLSILGYQMDGTSSSPDAQWLEFDNLKSNCRIQRRSADMEPEHLIPKSSFLELRDDYDYMVEQLEEQESLHTIPLGQHALITAVDTLAATQSRPAKARSLLVVNLMVREGSRFPAIADHLAKEFRLSLPLPLDMISSIYQYRYHSLYHLPPRLSVFDPGIMEGAPLKFDVEEQHEVGRGKQDDVWEKYENFVGRMRGIGFWQETDLSSTKKYRFDVILRTSRHSIRLRLERMAFNILGYQIGCSSSSSLSGDWLEFGYISNEPRWLSRFSDMPEHLEYLSQNVGRLIPGSSFLDLNFDYDELAEHSGSQYTGATIDLGQKALVDAVDALATAEEKLERAKSLLVVSLMVREGSRFPGISCHLAKEFRHSLPLPPHLISPVREHHFSALVHLRYVNNPGYMDDSFPNSSKRKSDCLLDDASRGKNEPDSVLDGDNAGNSNGVDFDVWRRKGEPDSSGKKTKDCKGKRDLLLDEANELKDNRGMRNPDFLLNKVEHADRPIQSSLFIEASGAKGEYDSLHDKPNMGKGKLDCHEDEADSSNCKLDSLQGEANVGKGEPDSVLKFPDGEIQSHQPTPALTRLPIVYPRRPRPLAEVFFLRIDDINHKDSGHFYGTIVVTDGLSSQLIYNQAKEDAEFVESGDIILLTGPRKSVPAHTCFRFNFTLVGEQESCDSQLCWDVDAFPHRSKYGKLMLQDYDGEHCTVTLGYIAYENAVEATVEVKIIGSNVGNVIPLWGQISAVSEKFGWGCSYKKRKVKRKEKFGFGSVLFRRKSTEHIEAHLGEPINLSRCLVAVPCNSFLIVRAELYVDAPDGEEVIAKGTATFSVQLEGSSEVVIKCKDSIVLVTVTWG